MHTFFLHSSRRRLKASRPLHCECTRDKREATSSRESAFSSGRTGSFFISRRQHWQLFSSAVCRWRWNRYRPESLVASLVLLLFIPRAQPGRSSRMHERMRDFASDDTRNATRIRQRLGTPYRFDNFFFWQFARQLDLRIKANDVEIFRKFLPIQFMISEVNS